MRLGDERAAMRTRLGPFRVFRRTCDAPETDYFIERGVQVTYDSAGRAEFLEFLTPAEPLLNGVPLLQRPIEDVLADLRRRGLTSIEDEGGAHLPAMGIGLFAAGGVVEGVSVGERDREIADLS